MQGEADRTSSAQPSEEKVERRRLIAVYKYLIRSYRETGPDSAWWCGKVVQEVVDARWNMENSA